MQYADPKDRYVKHPEPITVRDLAKLYGGKGKFHLKVLQRRCRAENWVKARKSYRAEVDRRSTEMDVSVDAEVQARFKRTSQKGLRTTQAGAGVAAQMASQRLSARLQSGEDNPRADRQDIEILRSCAAVLKQCAEVAIQLHGMGSQTGDGHLVVEFVQPAWLPEGLVPPDLDAPFN